MSDHSGNSTPNEYSSREAARAGGGGCSGKDNKFHSLELDESNVILISTRKRFNIMMKRLKKKKSTYDSF